MSRRSLPIGIQTFREIREAGHYYVDKTPHIERLVDDGKHFFLSRPRRFGKSLLLDTLKELFEGNEALFEGLAIHGNWDWSQRHPVVRLDFSHGDFSTPGHLHANVMAQLDSQEQAHGVEGRYDTAPERLGHLIEALHEREGKRTVLLIDDYDKPIIETLEEPKLARANLRYLSGLCSNVKYADAHIHFSLIAAVSKFSMASMFSGLNNLMDITLDPRYSSICGFTEADIETVFASELPGLDRALIRDWYHGYCWLGAERVYNPFAILLLFDSRAFKPHWFETATPAFLIETLFRRQVRSIDLDGMLATDELLSAFEVGAIAPEALLFQTGCLTIARTERLAGETFYHLRYPNREVRQSLNRSLLSHMVGDACQLEAHSARLHDLLLADDLDGLRELFHAFYASIPHQWYTNNNIANYEGFYASVFYSYFAGLGLDVTVEDSTSRGQLDMALRFEGRVYLFEFKVVEQAGEGSAMAQLEARRYADKYRASGPIRLVGVEFSSESRNIVSFETGWG